MIRLLLILCFLTNVAIAGESAISAGLEAATKGEITDPAVVGELVKIFDSRSAAESSRVSAAYLLTFAAPGLAPAPAATYASFALSQPSGPDLLGPDAVIRLYRIRADQAYDEAKFDLARDSYLQLRALSKNTLSDYATLRLGWTYMNKDDAATAFRLWMETAGEKTKAKLPISPNLLHGIGQSFSENGKRDGADALALGALATTPDAKAQLVRGLADGINYLKTPEKLKAWNLALQKIPFSTEVVGRVFEVSSASGERACELLSLIASDPRPSLPNDPYGRLVEVCVDSPAGKKHTALLGTAFAKLEVKGEERLARFNFRRNDQPTEACREGIVWIAEGSSAPVDAIVAVCDKSIVSGKDAVGKAAAAKPIAAALLSGSADRFQKETEPALHVTAALSKHPAFTEEIATAVLAAPETYRATLLPTLLAEIYFTNGNLARAEAFRTRFGSDAFPVWTRILSAKARGVSDGGKPAEAKAMLLAAGKTPSADTLSLWFPIIAKLADVPSERAFVTSTTATVLKEGLAKDPIALAAWIELGARQDLWTEVWTALKGDVSLSERLEADLFEAIASKKLRVDGKETISNPRLAAVVATGLAFAAGNSLETVRWPKKSPSPLGKDVLALQSLERRQAAALKPRKDSVAQVSAWVPFLGSASSELKRRGWINRRFRSHALGLLEVFCSKTEASLGALPASPQVSAEEWSAVVTQLQGRLGECRRWVAVTREKGKETVSE